MLTIRQTQLARLHDDLSVRYGDRVIAFIRGRYADRCAAFTEAELRGLVATALRRSREHGFDREADILRYVNIMYTLGCDFDRDPAFPWAAEILARPQLSGASKVDLLVARTAQHLREFEAAH